MKQVKNATWRVSIATAGAVLSASPAWAQSSVTLYGNLDAGLYYSNKSWQLGGTGTNPTFTNTGGKVAFVSSGLEPSFFGLMGSEDLGGGWRAKFRLESGISLANGGFDNSDGGIFGRHAWVGLASDKWGEVDAGLQVSPFVYAVFDLDPRNMYQFGSAITVYGDNTFDGIAAMNAVTYISPNLSGFSTRAMFAFGNEAGNFSEGRQYAINVRYDYGGFSAVAAIADANADPDATLPTSVFLGTYEGRLIGAMYKWKDVTVKASFTSYKGPEIVSVPNSLISGGDNNVWSAGFDWTAGPGINIQTGVYYSYDPHNSQNHGVMAATGVSYSLSKRTDLYAEVGAANNHGRSVLGLQSEADGGQLEAGNGTTIGTAIGMIHRF
jgi:predicted porin